MPPANRSSPASSSSRSSGLRHEPLLLAERIADALEQAAAAGPVLVVIDDVQWADRVSLFIIRTLLSRLLGLPVVWLLATRDDDPRADLIGLDVSRVEHIRLAPLSSLDLAAIAHDRLGTVPDTRTRGFLEACAGNPLLASQILDGMVRSAARGRPDAVPAAFNAAIAPATGPNWPTRRVTWSRSWRWPADRFR